MKLKDIQQFESLHDKACKLYHADKKKKESKKTEDYLKGKEKTQYKKLFPAYIVYICR